MTGGADEEVRPTPTAAPSLRRPQHSPTSYCFSLFDSLMLLVRGSVVYFGPRGHAAIEFARSACPNVKEYLAGYNDAEYLVRHQDRPCRGPQQVARIHSGCKRSFPSYAPRPFSSLPPSSGGPGHRGRHGWQERRHGGPLRQVRLGPRPSCPQQLQVGTDRRLGMWCVASVHGLPLRCTSASAAQLGSGE